MAGAQLIGKTHTDEIACGMFGMNPHFGTPINPQAPDTRPRRLSSGSASAVAAGLCDFALGTDTGGSIRVPASFCGLYGLRTSYGRISTGRHHADGAELRHGRLALRRCRDACGVSAKFISVPSEA